MTAGAPIVWVVAGLDTARRWVAALRQEGLAAGALAWSAPHALPWRGWPDAQPDVVLLTSPHAPQALPAGVGGGLPAACVGAATARAAQAKGFVPICVGEAGGEALARELLTARADVGRVVFLAGRGARREAVVVLESAGVAVQTVEVYSMAPIGDFGKHVAEAPDPASVVLGSPRAAEALHAALADHQRTLPGETFIAVLGAVTANRAECLFHRYVAVASRTDAEGLAATVRDLQHARNTDGNT